MIRPRFKVAGPGQVRAIQRQQETAKVRDEHYASVPMSATPTRQVLRALRRKQKKIALQTAKAAARKQRRRKA